jgi:hypothetical protein
MHKVLAIGNKGGYCNWNNISAIADRLSQPFFGETAMGTVWRGLVALTLLVAAGAWSQAGEKEIKTLLDKAIKACGGQVKMDGLKKLTWKGKMDIVEGTKQIGVTMDGTFQDWDKQRLDVEVNKNGQLENATLVINGKKGWTKDKNKVREISKELPTFANVVFAVRGPQLLAGLKDKKFQLSHLGEVKVGDQDAVGLRISRKESPDLSIFFSKKTHLPLKAETRLTDPRGKEIDMEIQFSDYKDFDGLKHFTKVTFKVEGKNVVMEVSELRPGAKLDANSFAMPK